MIICDLVRTAILSVAALMGLLLLSLPLWFLIGIVLVLGTGQLFFQAAYRAWLPDITEEEMLSNANAALEASDAVSMLTGSILGGVVIQALGAVLSLGIDAISYGISAMLFLSLRDNADPLVVGDQSQPRLSLSVLW